MVVDEEWPQMLEAFKKFGNYRPKVSIFICGYGLFFLFLCGNTSDILSPVNAITPNSGLRIPNSQIGMGTHVLGP